MFYHVVLEVSNEEIAHRVKEILDVERPDWTGAPLPYNAENPPPQVKVESFVDLLLSLLKGPNG